MRKNNSRRRIYQINQTYNNSLIKVNKNNRFHVHNSILKCLTNRLFKAVFKFAEN